MKILLVRPPAKYLKGSAKPSASLPLDLLYIAAILEKDDFVVEIYDAKVNAQLPLFHTSDNAIHMGDSWEAVEEEIAKRKPDILGITNPFTAQFENALKVAQIAKKVNENILTVVGGNHPTVRPVDFFDKTEAVDIACIGEGEYTMLEIARAHRSRKDFRGIAGTAIREDSRVRINPPRPYIQDLDSLPLPAYHLIDLERYFAMDFPDRPLWRYHGSERAISVVTSRGCPFNCIFCSIHLHMGSQWRPHSAEYVLRHLESVKSKYNVKHVHFEDDNLTLNAARFKDILNGLMQRKINLTWDTPNGIRADTLTQDLLQDSKRSGCKYIILGIESGEQRIISEVINKALDLAKVSEVAAWCKKIKLDAMSFFVIGFPGEKIINMKRTVDFALYLMRKYDLTPTIFIATPLFGTRLYEICRQRGYLRKEPTSDNLAVTTGGGAEESLIETEDFGEREIRMIMRRFIRGYKIILLYNIALFILKNPGLCLRFIRKVWSLRNQGGLKQAVAEVASMKNCL